MQTCAQICFCLHPALLLPLATRHLQPAKSQQTMLMINHEHFSLCKFQPNHMNRVGNRHNSRVRSRLNKRVSKRPNEVHGRRKFVRVDLYQTSKLLRRVPASTTPLHVSSRGLHRALSYCPLCTLPMRISYKDARGVPEHSLG